MRYTKDITNTDGVGLERCRSRHAAGRGAAIGGDVIERSGLMTGSGPPPPSLPTTTLPAQNRPAAGRHTSGNGALDP